MTQKSFDPDEGKRQVAGKSPPMKPKKAEMCNFHDLFKYSSGWDRFILWCGLIGMSISGFIAPGFGYVIGKCVLMFDPGLTIDESREILHSVVANIFMIAIAQFVFGWVGYTCLQISAERVTVKLRALYLNSLMRQEIEFFEK